MQFRSKTSFQTLKTIPSGSENRATGLLTQAGYIRQEMAGVYNYLPLGLKVLRKIEWVIREEMEWIGGQEVWLSWLSARESWEKTGRWDTIDVLFRVPAANNREYALNPTHEEIITPLMQEFTRSYKQLPTCVYQFQTKFRNEKRAKSGLMRGREFFMKDAYSFHTNQESLDQYYEEVKAAYFRIFHRLGIGEKTHYVYASGGAFSKYSHEFQLEIEVGEDLVFRDPETGIAYNKEIVISQVSPFPYSEKQEALEKHTKKGIIGVDDLCDFLNLKPQQTTKTLLLMNGEKMIAAVLRWDYELNMMKLQDVIWSTHIRMATPTEIVRHTGAEVGYAGLYNLPKTIEIFCDDGLETMTNFESGGNETGLHIKNINWWRDVEKPKKFYDIKEWQPGDLTPTGVPYQTFRASEIGNIFKLSTKFSKPFDLAVNTEDGKTVTPVMGCYGIGVSRLMGVIAEMYATEKWLMWPANIAPYSTLIVVHGDNLEKAKTLATTLEKDGQEILIDDRDVWFGMKMGDTDLLWIPNIILLTDKTLEKGGYELRKNGQEGVIVSLQ